MKRKVLLSLAMITFCLTVGFAKGKSYQVEALSIEALVEPSGSLAVHESIRYRFRGSFSFAFRDIPLKPGEKIDHIQVSEEGLPYGPGDSRPGTFEIESQPGRTRVTWHYKARNEARTFHLSYVLTGVVKRHADTAELHYQFVGDGWDHPIRQVRARVRFAEGLPDGAIQAWAHGPLDGQVAVADGSAVFEVAPLPARTFWEGRVLFPEDAVRSLPSSGLQAKPRILAEERGWAEEANRRRQELLQAERDRAELARQLLPWSILAAVFGVSLWTLLFFLHGKAYPAHLRHAPGEIPSEHPPAVVGYLLNRNVGASALAATLIDLSRRGFVKIIEKEREVSNLLGRKQSLDYRLELTGRSLEDLAGFEEDLVRFLLDSSGDGEGVWLRDFKKMAKRKRSKFARWFRDWRHQVVELGKKERFFEPFSARVLLLNIGSGLVIAGFGVFASVTSGSPVGVPAMIAGVLQAALSGLLNRRTPEGRELQLAWIEFKKHLRSISKATGPVSPQSGNLGRLLVASVLFGMHRDFVRLLEASDSAGSHEHFAWYVAHGGSHEGMGGFAGGLSSLVSSVGSAMSSTAGAGGGASVGGGGGSGGGGGGAG